MAAISQQDRETVRAQARYVRSSARKARLVLEHIRGRSATEATHILAFQTRAVARDAGKVLKSAIANAENNSGFDVDELVVVAAYADEGPTLKRWRARARGRVNRIKKRTCHITIALSPALPGEIKPRPERRARPATPAPAPAPEPEVAEDVAAAEEAAEETPKPRKPRARKPKAAPADAAPDVSSEPEPEATAEPEAPSEPEATAEPEAPSEPEANGEPEPESASEPEPEESNQTDEEAK
ncbi:MAG: 50S ribosomal protein L22 [Gaiellales bacterium]